MRRMGVDPDVLDSGCCGLAGNFGFEKGHYEVSQTCAERVLYPALRAADRDSVVLADGFSCRTQIEQGDAGGRQAVHLAELLAAALRGDPARAGQPPEQAYAVRPTNGPTASYAALAGVAAVAAAAAGLVAALVRRGAQAHNPITRVRAQLGIGRTG
jgi:hypothetical protein